MTLETLVGLAREKGASDLHIEPASPAVLRVRGELGPVGEALTPQATQEMTRQLLGDKRWEEFLRQRSHDLSQTIAGVRCRINVYQTLRGASMAVRLLSTFGNTLAGCHLNPDLARFLKYDTGLLLVCGPTGSGKSTTLAAFIEEINRARARHVITIESPIEYFFQNQKSFIRQREVANHTPSFERAIIDSMRQDPDVLVIGEMRTPDVMRLTLNAAETGHLVLSTIHSSTCAEALSRLCMSFPSDVQSSICHQVADCLVGVICQRLVYYPQSGMRVPVCEVLVATSGVKSIIRMGQFSKIVSAIQTGGDDGMWTFERYRRWADENAPAPLRQAAATPSGAARSPGDLFMPQRLEIGDASDDLDFIDPKKKT